MQDPLKVIKKEQRKSLLILMIMALYSILFGIVIVIGLSRGDPQMASNAGWIMIGIGILCIVLYVSARRRPTKHNEPPS
ncbi:hypothetical protein [Halomonas daqiaonensis]|uniref:Uncharacterized protein n=1 Tax=Halomonas daqiaonensis TaxID=650850 RepID=A0A1H7U362_9GAMM|nr:hypothetical protein [Halomonas daqiaonensis]SEL90687.1 hypothetical protein SAMN04488129_11924 [Halomonas daqiaonensis]